MWCDCEGGYFFDGGLVDGVVGECDVVGGVGG